MPSTEQHPYWSESRYLNFSDATSGLSGFARVAHAPASKRTDRSLVLWFPDGTLGVASLFDGGGADLTATTLTYDGEVHHFHNSAAARAFGEMGFVDVPRRRVRIELHATDEHPPVPDNYRPGHGVPAPVVAPDPARRLRRVLAWPLKVKQSLAMGGALHEHCAVSVRGSVAIDGRTDAFEGVGERDRSSGVRDMRVLRRWRWLSAHFAPTGRERWGFTFSVLKMTGTSYWSGHLWEGARVEPVTAWKLSNDWDASGIGASRFTLSLRGKHGTNRDFSADVVRTVPITLREHEFVSVLTSGRTRYRCGESTTWGLSEFMEQIEP